ncbi:MAG UNVERIFIED_CONTAM: diversity-generating retroelement protein Avd [Planctomycetaceae bacterium]|jgi:hypothetical protein
MKRRANEDLLVLTKTYDLLLWYVGHIGRFPKQHRYSLGQRIEKQLYKVLECLTVARYERPNRRYLEKANLRLELLRIQTRLAKDLQCLKGTSYEFAVKGLDEIGRMVGGWLRKSAGSGAPE